MRFRFRGGGDCPDWVLAEISTISKLSSVKLKLVCVQILNHIEQDVIKYETFTKLVDDVKFTLSDVKGIVAGVAYILRSALKFDVDSASLDNELQQLGFPKEHAAALTKAFVDRSVKAREALKSSSLRLPAPTLEWDVDYLLYSSHAGKIEKPVVNLTINGVRCSVGTEKLGVMVSELRQALKVMKNVKL